MKNYKRWKVVEDYFHYVEVNGEKVKFGNCSEMWFPTLKQAIEKVQTDKDLYGYYYGMKITGNIRKDKQFKGIKGEDTVHCYIQDWRS